MGWEGWRSGRSRPTPGVREARGATTVRGNDTEHGSQLQPRRQATPPYRTSVGRPRHDPRLDVRTPLGRGRNAPESCGAAALTPRHPIRIDLGVVSRLPRRCTSPMDTRYAFPMTVSSTPWAARLRIFVQELQRVVTPIRRVRGACGSHASLAHERFARPAAVGASEARDRGIGDGRECGGGDRELRSLLQRLGARTSGVRAPIARQHGTRSPIGFPGRKSGLRGSPALSSRTECATPRRRRPRRGLRVAAGCSVRGDRRGRRAGRS